MALQIAISSPFINSCSSQSQYSFALSPHLLSSDCLAGAAAWKKSAAVCSSNGYGIRMRKSWEQRSKVKIKASSETAVTVGQVTEVNKDTFWPIVNAAGEKVVVLDMYTQWCGPCKVMAPKFQELSEKHLDVVFLKLDCNQDNKPLAKELGIRVVPTFKILKDNKVVKEVTGAKLDDLVAAIEAAKSS